MATLGQFKDYDEPLSRLAEAQRYKLRLNAHKGWLGDVPPDRMLEFLKKEISELEDAYDRGSHIEVILEAADICNFALGFVISAISAMNKGISNANAISDRVSRPDEYRKVGHTSEEAASVRSRT